MLKVHSEASLLGTGSVWSTICDKLRTLILDLGDNTDKIAVEECLVKENSEKPGSFILKRTLYFDFSWEDEDEISEWEEDNTTTDDANLPSYVVGDYEGVCIADAMHDYETDYRGMTV